MNATTDAAKVVYKGAWLTDVDDTLLKSGYRPGDDWIEELADFVRVLKKHGIAWVPVSGVAINKMGPRMLYRLPEDVLSHVFYFGGEGSARSHYDADSGKWVDDPHFKRHFSDAQAMAVIGEHYFREWLAHHFDTLAIKSDGTLWAWGDNDLGQLGDGTGTDHHSPIQVGSDTDWMDISAGSYHSLAVKSNGTYWAWGYSAYGQVGDGTTDNRYSPVRMKISAGSNAGSLIYLLLFKN